MSIEKIQVPNHPRENHNANTILMFNMIIYLKYLYTHTYLFIYLFDKIFYIVEYIILLF